MNVPPICELKDGSHLHRFFFGVSVAHVSELHQVLLRKCPWPAEGPVERQVLQGR